MSKHKNVHYWELTGTQEKEFLEILEHCNTKTKATFPGEFDEATGMIANKWHWYQLTVDYIMPTLFEGKQYWLDVFCRRCLQTKAEHPIDWLHDMYLKTKAGESLHTKPSDFGTTHEKKEKKETKQKKK